MKNAPIFGSRVPILETERLTLRGHRPEDLNECAEMWADAIVTRYIGGKPFSREETWGKMLRYAGLWQLLGYGYWAVEERVTRRFIGELGFADFKRNIDQMHAPFPEIGWALVPSVHQRGYATEAVRAAVVWADENISEPQTICLIAPDNVASIRVAGRNNYHESGRLLYKGQPTILFQRSAGGAAAI